MSSFAGCVNLFVKSAPWAVIPPPMEPTRPASSRAHSDEEADAQRRQYRRSLAAFAEAREQRALCVSNYLVSLCGAADSESTETVSILAFVLYYSCFLLFWSQQQRRQQTEKGRTTQRDSSFDEFLFHRYGVSTRNDRGRAERVRENADGSEAHLSHALAAAVRLFPSPEDCLWRQPALLASFTALAEDVAFLQSHNHRPCHAVTRQGKGGNGEAQRVLPCPVCVAVALDDVLAAEAFWCLLALHAALHSETDQGGERKMTTTAAKKIDGRRRHHRGNPPSCGAPMRETLRSHVIAACRIGLVNGAVVAPTCLSRGWLCRAFHLSQSHDALPTLGRQRSFLLAVTNLVVQDEVSLRAHAQQLSALPDNASLEDGAHQRDEGDLIATLAALLCLVRGVMRGGGEADEEEFAAESVFCELTVHTPFPWLALPAPRLEESREESDATATVHDALDTSSEATTLVAGATLLAWVCGNGYLQAARYIVQAIFSTEGQRATKTTTAALTASLNATLASQQTNWAEKADLTRLLLLAGASAHGVQPEVAAQLCLGETQGSRDDADAAASTLPRCARYEILRMLYSPGLVLDAPLDSDLQSRQAGGGGQLLERLQSASTASSAADRLAQLALRLWVEKVQHLALPAGSDALTGDFVKEVLLAQDRVLRPTLAALAFDAYQPIARILLLAVLGRRLTDATSSFSPALLGRFASEWNWYSAMAVTLAEDEEKPRGALACAVESRVCISEAIATEECQLRQRQRQVRREDGEGKEGEEDSTPKTRSALHELQDLCAAVKRDQHTLLGLTVASAGQSARPLRTDCCPSETNKEVKSHYVMATVQSAVDGADSVSLPLYLRVSVQSDYVLSVWVRVPADLVDVAATLAAASTATTTAAGAAGKAKRMGAGEKWRKDAEKLEERESAVTACVGVVDTEMSPSSLVRRGDLILFKGVSPTDCVQDGEDGCFGFAKFEAIRVISPSLRATTVEESLFHYSCCVAVRCVLQTRMKNSVHMADSSSEYSSTSSQTEMDQSDHDSTAKKLRILQLQCVRFSLGEGQGEKEDEALVHPLHWLSARPEQSAASNPSIAQTSLPVDIISIVSSQPRLCRALHSYLFTSTAAKVGDACGNRGELCWVVQNDPRALLKNPFSVSEEAMCVWRLPPPIDEHSIRCRPLFPSRLSHSSSNSSATGDGVELLVSAGSSSGCEKGSSLARVLGVFPVFNGL